MSCPFCDGQPVLNGGAWIAPDGEPSYAACPRCGEVFDSTPSSSTADVLREAWLSRKMIRLTLTERCVIPTIVGRVTHVSVTSAHVVVDGWMVPVEQIRALGRPTAEDIGAYASQMHDLRTEVQ
jgi:hypothetical protein